MQVQIFLLIYEKKCFVDICKYTKVIIKMVLFCKLCCVVFDWFGCTFLQMRIFLCKANAVVLFAPANNNNIETVSMYV